MAPPTVQRDVAVDKVRTINTPLLFNAHYILHIVSLFEEYFKSYKAIIEPNCITFCTTRCRRGQSAYYQRSTHPFYILRSISNPKKIWIPVVPSNVQCNVAMNKMPTINTPLLYFEALYILHAFNLF